MLKTTLKRIIPTSALLATSLMLTGCGISGQAQSLLVKSFQQIQAQSDTKGPMTPQQSLVDNTSVNMNAFDQAIINNGFKPAPTEAKVTENIDDTATAMFSANSTDQEQKNKDKKDKEVSEDKKFPIKTSLQPNVSQQFLGVNDIEQRLIEALPEIAYHTNELSEFATKVNNANWSKDKPLDQATIIKIQSLLNWHNHGVGAVDGKFSRNTIKAMQAFQQARGLTPTNTMNDMTWNLLTANAQLNQQPTLIQYKLTREDARVQRQWGGYKNMQYLSVKEQLAEKFHMSRSLLTRLNPKTKLKSGNTITVYNPGQPNLKPVHRVEVYKRKNLLIAFDENDRIVASYPTTIGSRSPSGTHYVANRVINPSYNSDFSNRNSVLPPGPNNPVGLVWMGLSKPSFGIHGSPQPEMISRQRSHGCVRLTNWDALSLYGTMQDKAEVKFKNS